MAFTIPEGLHLVKCWGPGAANGVSTNGDWISLKNVHRAFIVAIHKGTNDTDLVVGFKEATAVAGTSAAAVTTTVPIYTSLGSTSDDTWTRETDAATYTIDASAKGEQIVVMQIDPAILSAGFDCLQAYCTGGHASNFACLFYLLQMRHKDDDPDSVIVD